jgi:SAM-dependent methyltransferase
MGNKYYFNNILQLYKSDGVFMKESYIVSNLIYDPDIYDGLNKQTDDLLFYLHWIEKKTNPTILELCCGTGRLTIPISQKGFKITGVDNNKAMLEMAKHKAHLKNVYINFVENDIRYLDLKTKFDIIFIPFNSIHHIYNNEDLFLVFDIVRRHLLPGGMFLFDCYNPDIRYIVKHEEIKQYLCEYTTEKGRKVVINQNMKYESDSQINHIIWYLEIDEKPEVEQSLDMRMYYPQEMNAYLQTKGFETICKYGDFDSSKFKNDSPKQIFMCKLMEL